MTNTIKSAPKDKPILVWDAGFWRPIQWNTGRTHKDGWWKCHLTGRNLGVIDNLNWMPMPPNA